MPGLGLGLRVSGGLRFGVGLGGLGFRGLGLRVEGLGASYSSPIKLKVYTFFLGLYGLSS